MKMWYLGIGIVLNVTICQGQVTEKLAQIVKLQLYISELEKGYSIVQKGLTTIGDIKNGHLKLDDAFFAGLKSVNPNVKQYEKVADIIVMRDAIFSRQGSTVKAIRRTNIYSEAELSYINTVFANLLTGSDGIVSDLNKVVTPGSFQMSDDERIHRIDVLYNSMQDRYSFCELFSNEVQVQALQRGREKQGIATLRTLGGQ